MIFEVGLCNAHACMVSIIIITVKVQSSSVKPHSNMKSKFILSPERWQSAFSIVQSAC